MRKPVSVLLAFVMAFMLVPSPAFAEVGGYVAASVEAAPLAAPDEGGAVGAATPVSANSVEMLSGEVQGGSIDLAAIGLDQSDDELFEGYVDQAFEQAALPVMQRTALRVQEAASDDTSARAQLTPYEQALYDLLAVQVKAAAEGGLQSGQIVVQCNDLIAAGYLKETYTAADLGVDTILAGESGYSQTAKNNLTNLMVGNMTRLTCALLQDHPFDTYWIDKTRGFWAAANFGAIRNVPCFTLSNATITFNYRVLSDYSATGEAGTFDFNQLKARAASTAAANAGGVVKSHKNENDIRKLDSYRKYICDSVVYDTPALSEKGSDGNAYYGDPWQLISVFDGDESTNVVCEGYSKAFKRLCELSTFNNPSVTCYVADGIMRKTSGGYEDHMWNIVSINRNTYLVDVTNCDSGSSGCKLVGDGQYEPGTALFMVGYQSAAPAPGDSFMDGYTIGIPAQTASDGSSTAAATMGYFCGKQTMGLFPESVLALSSWNCPLEESADAALAVDAQVMAIVNDDAPTAAELDAAKAAYNALTSAQKALVQQDPNGIELDNLDQVESNAAAESVVKLEWGKASNGSGSYSNDVNLAGSVAWSCGDTSLKKFKVSLYDADDDQLLLTRYADFSAGNRKNFSYYLPQDTDLDSGTYYFTVEPRLEAGKPAPEADSIAKSGTWEYTAPDKRLAAPSDIELDASKLIWKQPARQDDASSPYISQYAFFVFHSTDAESLDAADLNAATFDANGVPQASHDGAGATFSPVIGAVYDARIGSTAKTCTFDLGKFMKAYIDRNRIANASSGRYYFYVRTVSSNIAKYRSNMHGQLMKGLTADEVAAVVANRLDEIVAGSGADAIGSGGVADQLAAIHPAQLEVALADAAVAEKMGALDAMTGVSVAVEQGEGAPAELFGAQASPAIVGAALNPLAADNASGEVKLLVDAASASNLAVPDGYDPESARAFSMSLEGVDDQENLTIPVRVSLPLPAGVAADSVAVVHYEKANGTVAPTVVEPVIEQRGGVDYASFVLTSFSDFALVQPIDGTVKEIVDGLADSTGEGDSTVPDSITELAPTVPTTNPLTEGVPAPPSTDTLEKLIPTIPTTETAGELAPKVPTAETITELVPTVPATDIIGKVSPALPSADTVAKPVIGSGTDAGSLANSGSAGAEAPSAAADSSAGTGQASGASSPGESASTAEGASAAGNAATGSAAAAEAAGSATSSAAAAVAVPSKVAGVSAKAGKKSAKVKWKAAKRAKSYQVAWRAKGASKWKKASVKRAKYTVKKLKAGKRYQVRVRAKNAGGWGAWSKTVTTKKIA